MCEDNAPLPAIEERLTAIVAAVVAYLDTQHGWEQIWLQWQQGTVTDAAYQALRRLGALAGCPDHTVIPAFDRVLPDPEAKKVQPPGRDPWTAAAMGKRGKG